jgi:hypothetical protein
MTPCAVSARSWTPAAPIGFTTGVNLLRRDRYRLVSNQVHETDSLPRLPGPPEIEVAALAHDKKAGNERAFGQRHSQSTGDLCTTTSWGFFARRNDKAGTGVTAP